MSTVSSPTLKGGSSHLSAKSSHSFGSSLKLHRNPVVAVVVTEVVAVLVADVEAVLVAVVV